MDPDPVLNWGKILDPDSQVQNTIPNVKSPNKLGLRITAAQSHSASY